MTLRTALFILISVLSGATLGEKSAHASSALVWSRIAASELQGAARKLIPVARPMSRCMLPGTDGVPVFGLCAPGSRGELGDRGIASQPPSTPQPRGAAIGAPRTPATRR